MFPMYHEFFGDFYDDIYGQVDKIAEEIRALDEFPVTSFARMLTISTIKETDGPIPTLQMVRETHAGNEVLGASWDRVFAIATAENRQGLANYAAERIDAHRKHAWMLRSMLKKVGATNESVEPLSEGRTYEIKFNK